jgi:hypothetical protein
MMKNRAFGCLGALSLFLASCGQSNSGGPTQTSTGPAPVLQTPAPAASPQSDFMLRYGVHLSHPPEFLQAAAAGDRTMFLVRGDVVLIFEVDRFPDHFQALKHLKDIESEYPARVSYVARNSYPALVRTLLISPMVSEHAEQVEREDLVESSVVLASGGLVLHARARNPVSLGDAGEVALHDILATVELPAVKDTAQDTAADLKTLAGLPVPTRRGLVQRQLAPEERESESEREREHEHERQEKRQGAAERPMHARSAAVPGATEESEGTEAPGAAAQFPFRGDGNQVDSELEIVVDATGRRMVMANNGGFPTDVTISNNYGFPGSFVNCSTGSPTCTITNQPPGPNATAGGSDPSLAIGASGNFYLSAIAAPPNVAVLPVPACGNYLYTSTFDANNNISGFTFTSIANGTQNFFADQEHIAADPVNQNGGQDIIYVVHRRFSPCVNVSGGVGPMITCSPDGGATWATPVAIGAGDFPRVSVARDGTALVSYLNGSSVMLARYNQCQPGTGGGLPTITQIGGPTTVDGAALALDCTTPGSAVPGLDRCNVGNDLRSSMVTADPANASNVFVVHAEQTATPLNDNVVLDVSTDGGLNFTQTFTLNTSNNRHRYLPWVCATNTQVFASWYDMRAATAASNSLFDYFGRSVSIGAGGVFTLNPEFQINDVQDSTCAAGFPIGVYGPSAGQATSSDECPGSQTGATCFDSTGSATNPVTLTRYGQCDLSDCGSFQTNNTTVNNPCTCPVDPTLASGNTVCRQNGGGPKYGDYSGNACSNGRLYAAWAQGKVATPSDIDVQFKCSTNPNDVTATPYTPDVTAPTIVATTVPPAPAPLNTCRTVALTRPTGLDICGDPNPTVLAVVNGATVDLNTFKFPRNSTTINWFARDASNNTSAAGPTTVVTVNDTTPPVVTAPASVNVSLCSATLSVTVGQATAVDDCVTPSTPTGQVIISNGVTLPSPIPVVGGKVTLGFGTHVIRWTSTDGITPGTADQTVVVGTKIETSTAFTVEDRGVVRTPGGTLAAVLNAGTGQAFVGNDGRVGDILSVGNVRVLDRATVAGNIRTASNANVNPTATVTGTTTQFASVFLPPIPTLPAFPPQTGGNFTINSGQTVSLSAGSYGFMTINSGGTLFLGAGDFYFRNFTMINSAVTVRVSPATRLFVSGTFAYRTPFTLTNGQVQAIFLGFTGTSAVLEARFDGTLVAPNASIAFGVGSGLTFTGSFFAKSFDIRPQSVLVCL